MALSEDEEEEDEEDDDDEEEEEKKKSDSDMDEEEMLQTNADDVDNFRLPSAEESESVVSVKFNKMEKEMFCKWSDFHPSPVFSGVVSLDLKSVHQRIKDNIDVLCNFSAKREEGKDRVEYLSLLKKDLCTYYSYNEFLIEKLMDLFPLSEVCLLVLHLQI